MRLYRPVTWTRSHYLHVNKKIFKRQRTALKDQMSKPRAAVRGPGGGGLPRAPTLIGPQLESKSLKLSRFFKLVRAFLKLRASYSSSRCSLAKV
jgi:hypothetical protein